MNVKLLHNQHVRDHINFQRGLLVLVFFLLSAFGAQAQTVTSDKDDYAPGEVAIITGTGWTNDQYVDVHFEETPAYHEEHQHDYHGISVVNGSWTIKYQIEERHIGVSFKVHVVGKQSGGEAFTYFTDANVNFEAAGLTSGTPTIKATYTVYATDGITTINTGVKEFVYPGPSSLPNIAVKKGEKIVYSFNEVKVGTAMYTAPGSSWTSGTDGVNVITIVAKYSLVANRAPVANNDSYTTNEDSPLAVAASGVLGNDTDADGNTLTASVVTIPSNGAVSLSSSGSFTYTPNANFNGSDSFTYKVNDGTVDGNTATVSITVTAVNDAPVATAQSVTTNEDGSVSITLAGTDVDGDALTYAVVTAPSNGTFANGTYTPNRDFNGTDSFTFTATDGSLTSAPATVSITVTAVNDAPVATAQSVTTNEDEAKAIVLAGTDVDGDALTYAVVTAPSNGTFANGTYTPNRDFNGTDSFTFTATDGSLTSAAATVSITVTAVNDAHVVNNVQAPTDPVAITTDIKTIVSATFTDVDLDANTYTATWNWGNGATSVGAISGLNGTFSVSVRDSYKYTAAGVYTVTVTVTDNNRLSVTSAPFEYLVIYDPSAGFVTGGGFIDSPEGALVGSTAKGKAHFGFVSKYEKGANKPSGNTQFQFQAGDFSFKSTEYEWLTISGPKAQYKGKGTINGGTKLYNFILTAHDAQRVSGGDGIDKFRIKITDGDVTVYDNQLSGALDADATTPLVSGSIVIHEASTKSTSTKSVVAAGTVAPETYETTKFQNYPNPYNDRTTITFSSVKEESFALEVYDVKGALVKKVDMGVTEAGKTYSYELESRNMPEGMYFARLITASGIQTIKMVLKR